MEDLNCDQPVLLEREVEGIVILAPGRVMKGLGESTLRQRLDQLVRDGHRLILIDLGHIPHMDSSELGRLIRAHISVRQAGGRVRLFNLSERVLTLMKLTRLDTVLDLFATEEEALAALRPRVEPAQIPET